MKLLISGKLKRAVKNKNMEINAAMEFTKTIQKKSQGFESKTFSASGPTVQISPVGSGF